MGDGVQENSEKPKTVQPADKAGWVKKSGGGLLSLWKDRYILLCKTQLLVYESEDDQKCVETIELGSYEACQDLRSLLKKNRFILIRSPGNKVQDIKFQAKSPEEKEGWIKALSEGINKGKNRIFDEVTVDKNLALEHVTRDRAKVAHGRRPPTRIHLKEVASTASDGLMRLDLDVEDIGALNFTPDTNETADSLPIKEVPKPPMPPVKQDGLPALETSHLGNGSVAEVHPQVPIPPPKALKEKAWKGKLDSKEDSGEGVERESTASNSRSSNENITEVHAKNGDETSFPAPKISSEKLKVKWDEPSSGPEHVKETKALATSTSRESIADVTAEDAGKPPIPPPKILTKRLKIQADESHSSQRSLEATDQDVSPVMNAIEDKIQDQSEESLTLGEELQTKEDNETETEEEEGVELANKEQQELSSDKACKQPFSESMVNSCVLPKPRCSSVGDLLSEGSNGKEGQLLHLRKYHLHRMEIKLASGQEKTELLLQKVLDGGLEQEQEGKESQASAGMLLKEAVQELRQATEVLQEIKNLGELEEKSEVLTEEQKEKQKNLMCLYRRSIP